jgi:protein-tyrosine phosphatase
MIDIHCHLLYDIDDGPRSQDVSLAMARQAYEAGVTTLVCTPHSPNSSASRHYTPALIRQRTAEMQNLAHAAGYEITLLPGTEINYYPTLQADVENQHILTLAGSRTLLIEMPVFAVDMRYLPTAETLISAGYTVVMAHPERYIYNTHDLENLKRIHAAGVLFQVTAVAVDEENSAILFQHDLVDLVASDAHSATYRPTAMGWAYQYVADTYDHATAERLFVQTPQRILGLA